MRWPHAETDWTLDDGGESGSSDESQIEQPKMESPSDSATDATTGGPSPTTTLPTPDAAPGSATAADPSEGPSEYKGWTCEPFTYAGNPARSISKDGTHVVFSVDKGCEPSRIPLEVIEWLLDAHGQYL